MLVEKIKLQEILDDILELINIKSEWENNKNNRKMNVKVKNISKKLLNKYVKTSDSDTVIDLINTISNNNEIIDIKPNNIKEFVKEEKKELKKMFEQDKELLTEFISEDFIEYLIENKNKTVFSYINDNKFSLLYKENPDKYYELVKLYSTYHGLSEDIYSEDYLLPMIEEAFLDNTIPNEWELCFDNNSQKYYYYNEKKDTSSWLNPNIELWKERINKKRYENKSNQVKIKRKINMKKKTPIKINQEDILIDLEHYNFSESPSSCSSNNESSIDSPLRRSPRIKDMTRKKYL